MHRFLVGSHPLASGGFSNCRSVTVIDLIEDCCLAFALSVWKLIFIFCILEGDSFLQKVYRQRDKKRDIGNINKIEKVYDFC